MPPRFVAPLLSSHSRQTSSSSDISEVISVPSVKPSLEIQVEKPSLEQILPPPVHPARLSPIGASRPPSPSPGKLDTNALSPTLSPLSPPTVRPPTPLSTRRSPSPTPSTLRIPQVSVNGSPNPSYSPSKKQFQNDEEYTEEELRTMYEDEEIQRFLSVFHAQVNEVTLSEPQIPKSQRPSSPEVPQAIAVISPDGETLDESAKVIARLSPPAECQTPSAEIKITAPSTTSLVDSDYEDEESDSESDFEQDQDWVSFETKDAPPQPLPASDASTSQPELLNGSGKAGRRRSVKRERQPSLWLSEKAAEFVVRHLPDSRAIDARMRRGKGRPTKFTISRMRSTAQRTYLATYPVYVPLLLRLWDIARWIDWWKSARLCAIYWTLWYYNLLLPALLTYFTFQLIRHRLVPYPTLEQLQRRRLAAQQAEQFSDALADSESSAHGGKRIWKSAEGVGMGLAQSMAAACSSDNGLGLWTMWKIATGNISSGKPARKEKGKERATVAGLADHNPGLKSEEDEEDEVLTRRQAKDAADWRRIPLIIGDEWADIHERVKNIVLWRRPDASKKYTLILAMLTLVVTFLPAQYLAKAVYGGLGALFWFVIPVLCAMSRKQRQRIPPPFYDVPTDAEYAMEIIGMRLAQGKSVVPAKQKGFYRGRNKSKASISTIASKLKHSASQVSINSPVGLSPKASPDSPAMMSSTLSPTTIIDSPGEITNSPAETIKRVELSHQRAGSDSSQERKKSKFHRLVDGVQEMAQKADQRIRDLPSQNQVFTAHYKHLPGIITLNTDDLQFTPLLSNRERIKIELDSIRGVKKAGRFKGLTIRYMALVPARRNEKGELEAIIGAPPVDYGETRDEGSERLVASTELEVKFNWVGGRDELFARIVGSRGTQWISV
ncbi:hypothetical protein FRC03_012406 [Tulasnella sp. 419]|nr:hypothetical protein FRC03_012406 [Tulasnella sp. 419]